MNSSNDISRNASSTDNFIKRNNNCNNSNDNHKENLIDGQFINPIILEKDFRITKTADNLHEHHCDAIIIAEDNKNILKRYTKHLDKKRIP